MSTVSFAIGIPTVNQAEQLNKYLAHYVDCYKDIPIIIIDNGNQEIMKHKNIAVYKTGENIGVSASWNLICHKAMLLGVKYVLLLNDDIMYANTPDGISDIIIRKSERLFSPGNLDLILSFCEWSVVLLPLFYFYEVIGIFDEDNFFNYFSDNDYMYRVKLAGRRTIHSYALNPGIYNKSLSIKKDPALNESFDQSKQNYIKKWGGLPNFEQYKTPYNK